MEIHFNRNQVLYLVFHYLQRSCQYFQCQPLIQKIFSIFGCWSAKFLSYVGRVQLIKVVLCGIQTYWCQVFLIPKKVLNLMQVACRNLLGATKRALIAWDTVSLPKVDGGMNITDNSLWNQAAICKLMWNVHQKKHK